VDLTGTNIENAEVTVLVELVWEGFRTAPAITAS